MSDALHHEAMQLLQLGDAKVVDVLWKALIATEAESGEISAATAQSAFIFGMTAVKFQKAEQGALALKKALRIRREVLGPQDTATAITIGALGNALMQAKQFAEAEVYLQESIDTAETILGKTHANTAYAYSSLANCFTVQGKLTEAIEKMEIALRIHEDVAEDWARKVEESIVDSIVSSPAVLRTAMGLGKLKKEVGEDASGVYDRFGGEHVLAEAIRELENPGQTVPSQQMMC